MWKLVRLQYISKTFTSQKCLVEAVALPVTKSKMCSYSTQRQNDDHKQINESAFSTQTFLRYKRHLVVAGLLAGTIAVYEKWKKKFNDISIISKVYAVGDSGDKSTFGLREKFNFIADVVEKVSPAVVCIESSSLFRQGAGSGFIVSRDGLIVTNAHVVQSARHGEVQVKLSDGKKHTGKLQVLDSASDLALIRINAVNLPTIKLGNSQSLRPGEYVVALGSPLTLSNTVTSGIISSTARNSKELGLRNGINYIQTDAPITFGNSGGPLINLDGEAVGVNSMKITDGISFAIPSDDVKKFLAKADQYKQEKLTLNKSRPPYIGIMSLTLTPNIAAQLRSRPEIINLDIDHGLFVAEVKRGSPACQAGIKKYDVIMKMDNFDLNDYEDLIRAIKDKQMVKCTVRREGKDLEIYVKPRYPTD